MRRRRSGGVGGMLREASAQRVLATPWALMAPPTATVRAVTYTCVYTTYINIHIYIHISITYICIQIRYPFTHTHTHTHTHIPMCVCVCVCVCAYI